MSDKSIFITGAIILTTLFSVGLYMVKGLYRDMKAMNNMEETRFKPTTIVSQRVVLENGAITPNCWKMAGLGK